MVNLKSTNVQSPDSNGTGRVTSSGPPAATAAPSKGGETLAPGQDPLVKAAQAIEEFVPEKGPTTKLRIDKDDDTGRFVYKSVDAESGEVIKQFPPETILELISQYRSLEGLVVDNDA